LHSSVTRYRQQRQQEEQKMSLVKSKLRDLVGSVKQLLSGHGRLLADVKALLKTMAKVSVKKRERPLSRYGSCCFVKSRAFLMTLSRS